MTRHITRFRSRGWSSNTSLTFASVVAEFCKRYPSVRRDDFLYRAIELANAAEKTFKPELGKFSTHLGGFARKGRLKELHRLHDQQEKEQGVEIYRTKEDLAHEAAEEAGEPTDPVNFAGGGNGVRLLFDRQWWEARISDIVCRVRGRDRAHVSGNECTRGR